MDNNNFIHTLDASPVDGMPYKSFFTYVAIAVVVGTLIGFGFSRLNIKSTGKSGNQNSDSVQSAGVADKKTFKDSTQGMLREGGIDGEGNFHLERPGGVSQNVYLTSSTVDLSIFVGKKVKVWGQTMQAQTAGWLMDVGSVDVIK